MLGSPRIKLTRWNLLWVVGIGKRKTKLCAIGSKTIRDLKEDKAIRKKAMRPVTNRKSSFRSCMNTASPARSRRGVTSSTFRERGLRPGAIALPVLQRKSGPGGRRDSGGVDGLRGTLRQPPNHRRVTAGRRAHQSKSGGTVDARPSIALSRDTEISSDHQFAAQHTLPVHENVLNQTFSADRPHAVWMADITYIPTEEGWLYLASLEDLYTRKIVGWAVDRRMTQDLVLRALDRAVTHSQPPAGVLHHLDRGSP
ncbi:MAG: hypothetical protein C7B47_14355 [Sulfobacillus thermosulfidooxidans]|uniref:Integrase catalytic domain-containing protein n=1 Tax=Sulfobacillus thermosulfidooxidans TaxID=28034 RepID=A0A2T2WQV8_SULTH|nr:MAG: hypothetical protein C7B47_14355 [Sulfobacillus thermosulfidooxidans]